MNKYSYIITYKSKEFYIKLLKEKHTIESQLNSFITKIKTVLVEVIRIYVPSARKLVSTLQLRVA